MLARHRWSIFQHARAREATREAARNATREAMRKATREAAREPTREPEGPARNFLLSDIRIGFAAAVEPAKGARWLGR